MKLTIKKKNRERFLFNKKRHIDEVGPFVQASKTRGGLNLLFLTSSWKIGTKAWPFLLACSSSYSFFRLIFAASADLSLEYEFSWYFTRRLARWIDLTTQNWSAGRMRRYDGTSRWWTLEDTINARFLKKKRRVHPLKSGQRNFRFENTLR